MTLKRKSSSFIDDDRPVIQLNSGQMVFAICALLISWLVFFVLGMVVARFENAISDETIVAQVDNLNHVSAPAENADAIEAPQGSQKQTSAPDSTKPKPSGQESAKTDKPEPKPAPAVAPKPRTIHTTSAKTRAAEGTTLSPRPVSLPAVDRPAPPAKPVEQTAATPPVEQTKPASADAAPKVVEADSVPAPQSEQKEQPKPEEPGPAVKDTPTAAPEQDDGTIVPEELLTQPPEQNTTAEQPAAVPAQMTDASAMTGTYTIQVAAISAKYPEQADEYKRLLSENANMTAKLVLSEDKKYIRVWVGDYADKASADEACAEMKKRKGFSSCFVKKLK